MTLCVSLLCLVTGSAAHIQLNYVFIIKMDDVTGSSPPTVPPNTRHFNVSLTGLTWATGAESMHTNQAD